MDRLLNVMTILSLVLMAVVLFSVRRSHIRVEYSVSWLGAALILLVLSRSPGALYWIAKELGLTDPPLALLILVFCHLPCRDLPALGGDLRSEGRQHRHGPAAGHSRISAPEFE